MLRLREIGTATFLRFLPTIAVGTLGLMALFGVPLASTPPSAWLYIAKVLLSHSVGFGLLMVLYRNRLGPDAAVGGRRTIIVGAFGLVLLTAVAQLGAGVISGGMQWPIWALTGTIAAAVMYWPWLRRPSDPDALAAWEAVDFEALSDAERHRLGEALNRPEALSRAPGTGVRAT